MWTNRQHPFVFAWLTAMLLVFGGSSRAADGVFLRIKLVEPANESWFVRLGGYIHNDPWVLPSALWPADADKDPAKRVAAGQFSPWFDMLTHAGGKLHGRQKRA